MVYTKMTNCVRRSARPRARAVGADPRVLTHGLWRFIAVLDGCSRVVPRLQYLAKSLEVLGPALHEPVAIFLDLETGLHHREQGPAVAILERDRHVGNERAARLLGELHRIPKLQAMRPVDDGVHACLRVWLPPLGSHSDDRRASDAHVGLDHL